MIKINHLRLFSKSNSLPHRTHVTIYKTNSLAVFDYGIIIYDNCFDGGKNLLDKAQLLAAKTTLGCLKSASLQMYYLI